MSPLRKLAGIGLATALLLGAAACGDSDDDAAKRSANKTTTTNGGKVDTKDGTVKYTDGDGDKIEYGSGASLPKGWPKDLEPPKTVDIVNSSSTTQGNKKVLFVNAESSAPFDDLYAGIKAQLTEGGYEITTDSNIDSGGAGYAGFEASNATVTVSISLAEGGGSGGKTAILFNVTPKD